MFELKDITFDECERIFLEVDNGTSKTSIYEAVRKIFAFHTLMSVDLARGEVFWRGQKCPDANGFETVSRLSYPPVEYAKVGRLNDAEQPMLYCATNPLTVFNELKAEDGDFIHIVGFKHFPGATTRMAKVGDAYHLFRSGNTRLFYGEAAQHLVGMMRQQFDDPRFMPSLYIDAFLSEALAKADAALDDYVRTRAIANEVLIKHSEIDGLFYPTVREVVGTNVALKPLVRNRLQVVASAVFQIRCRRRMGFYEYAIVRDALALDSPDIIRWATSSEKDRIRFFNMTETEAQQDERLHNEAGLSFKCERDSRGSKKSLR